MDLPKGHKAMIAAPISPGEAQRLAGVSSEGGFLPRACLYGSTSQRHGPAGEEKTERRCAMGKQKDSSRADGSHGLEHARSLGYSEEELKSVPEGVACRGCGNPTALADLQEGQTVLDVGSGAGLDAFLAARKVGAKGRVIGIDLSAEMVAKANEYAAKGKYGTVTFQVAPMEHLPLEDESVDVAISNCVINYGVDKLATFRELFRCLKPNGRILICDLVAEGGFSEDAFRDEVWGEWLAGAAGKREYLKAIEKAGFREIEVVEEGWFAMSENDERLRGRIRSIKVKAFKRVP
jgi:arsenite methyltransferase